MVYRRRRECVFTVAILAQACTIFTSHATNRIRRNTSMAFELSEAVQVTMVGTSRSACIPVVTHGDVKYFNLDSRTRRPLEHLLFQTDTPDANQKRLWGQSGVLKQV